MKKIFYTAILIFCAAFAGCSDTGEEIGIPILGIERADVLFDSTGGTGVIIVQSDTKVTAVSSESQWCVVESISGNRVNISAPVNQSISGRSSRITITADGKQASVTAHQDGVFIDVSSAWIEIPQEGGSAVITIASGYSLTMTTASAEWLSRCEMNSEQTHIFITAGENNNLGLGLRKATLTLTTADGIARPITVVQGGIPLTYEDYLGEYTVRLVANSSGTSSSAWRTWDFTIAQYERGSSYTVSSPNMNYEFIAEYDAAAAGLNIFGAQAIMTSGGYTYGLHAWDTNAGYLSYGTTSGLRSSLVSSTSDQPLSFTFVDNGRWGTYVANGFYVSRSGTATQDHAVTVPSRLYNFTFTKQ